MSCVENLHLKYSGLNIDIPRWEILDEGVTGLWGPSGSGKTTIFRMLLGLEACPELKWSFQGVDLAKLPTPQRRLGVVFQSLDLFPHMSAEENIYFSAKARSVPRERYQIRLEELTEALKLGPFLKRKAALLSGGEKQRVAIARAIAGEPRLLLLDEPFASLDQDLRQESRQLIKKILQVEKIPTLLVTHDEQDVAVLGNKICYLEDGKIREP